MKHVSILIMVFIIYTFNSCSRKPQKQITINPQDSVVKSDLKWKNKIYDFGNVKQDSIISAKYTFYNTGDKELIIFYVNPYYSCTSYELSRKRVPINDSAYITLNLNTKNKIGKQHLYTTVCANTEARMYKLTLKAYVEH